MNILQERGNIRVRVPFLERQVFGIGILVSDVLFPHGKTRASLSSHLEPAPYRVPPDLGFCRAPSGTELLTDTSEQNSQGSISVDS